MSGGYQRENLNISTESGPSEWVALGMRIAATTGFSSRLPKGTQPTVSFPLETLSSLALPEARSATRAAVDWSADEALPHTPPGGKPPETPGPLSLELDSRSQEKFVKGSLRRQKAPPLTNFSCSGGIPGIRERGPNGRGCSELSPASRWSAPKSGSKLKSGKVYLTNTGLLIEDAEKTPIARVPREDGDSDRLRDGVVRRVLGFVE